MSEALVTLYAPLWGAQFDSDEGGAIAPGVMVCVPYPEEWQTVEQSDVQRVARQAHAGQPPAPPLCICAHLRCANGESLADAVAHGGAGMRDAVADAVTALRLSAPGWFLDPGLSSLTYATVQGGWQLLRSPGPYRQAAVAGIVPPLPAYALSIDDLKTTASEGKAWAMAALVAAFRRNSGNAAGAIAISQFNRSFGFTLAAADRAAMLFTAIDAIMGGMSARAIGRIPLRPRFRRRVALALLRGGMSVGGADTESAWLDWQDGGRRLRNALAHGDMSAIAGRIADDDVLRLQAIVRALLPPFLQFAVVGDHDPAIGLTAAFNQSLTMAATL